MSFRLRQLKGIFVSEERIEIRNDIDEDFLYYLSTVFSKPAVRIYLFLRKGWENKKNDFEFTYNDISEYLDYGDIDDALVYTLIHNVLDGFMKTNIIKYVIVSENGKDVFIKLLDIKEKKDSE